MNKLEQSPRRYTTKIPLRKASGPFVDKLSPMKTGKKSNTRELLELGTVEELPPLPVSSRARHRTVLKKMPLEFGSFQAKDSADRTGRPRERLDSIIKQCQHYSSETKPNAERLPPIPRALDKFEKSGSPALSKLKSSQTRWDEKADQFILEEAVQMRNHAAVTQFPIKRRVFRLDSRSVQHKAHKLLRDCI